MYSMIYLYEYELMDIYFMLWIIIQYDVTYFVAPNCASFDHWQLFQLAHVFLQQAHHLVFWTLQDIPGLSYIFPASTLETATPKSPHSFNWRIKETNIWVLGLLAPPGVQNFVRNVFPFKILRMLSQIVFSINSKYKRCISNLLELI